MEAGREVVALWTEWSKPVARNASDHKQMTRQPIQRRLRTLLDEIGRRENGI
jgi:hypothetical protein